MFKWLKNWWTKFDATMDEVVDDLTELGKLDDNDKQFNIKLTVTSDTKIRKLKTTMLDAITQRLAETNPEITNIDITLDYQKHK